MHRMLNKILAVDCVVNLQWNILRNMFDIPIHECGLMTCDNFPNMIDYYGRETQFFPVKLGDEGWFDRNTQSGIIYE